MSTLTKLENAKTQSELEAKNSVRLKELTKEELEEFDRLMELSIEELLEECQEIKKNIVRLEKLEKELMGKMKMKNDVKIDFVKILKLIRSGNVKLADFKSAVGLNNLSDETMINFGCDCFDLEKAGFLDGVRGRRTDMLEGSESFAIIARNDIMANYLDCASALLCFLYESGFESGLKCGGDLK